MAEQCAVYVQLYIYEVHIMNEILSQCADTLNTRRTFFPTHFIGIQTL